uniref:Uncharacterized protein n=1 Tax=Piliocolobus tephrosceles TaxID=591936 RepID=A0A8C9IN85_9PRIM
QGFRNRAAGKEAWRPARGGLCLCLTSPSILVEFTGKYQQPSGSEGEDGDVEAALKKEVGDIKASTEMRLRRFQAVESGANNVHLHQDTWNRHVKDLQPMLNAVAYYLLTTVRVMTTNARGYL